MKDFKKKWEFLAKQQDTNSISGSFVVETSKPLLGNGYILPKVILEKVVMLS